MANCAWVC